MSEEASDLPTPSPWEAKTTDEVVADVRRILEAIRDERPKVFVPMVSCRAFAYPAFVRSRENRNRWLAALRKFFERASPPCHLPMPILKRIALGDISAWPAQFTTYRDVTLEKPHEGT